MRRKGKAPRTKLIRLGSHVVELRIVSKVQAKEVKGRKPRKKGKR